METKTTFVKKKDKIKGLNIENIQLICINYCKGCLKCTC